MDKGKLRGDDLCGPWEMGQRSGREFLAVGLLQSLGYDMEIGFGGAEGEVKT